MSKTEQSGELSTGTNDHPPRRKVVTIQDVAEAAGVSSSTVSRAFARPGRVNAQTALRVRRIADQLGYRSQQVQPVADDGRSTRQIAFVVPDLSNPVFAGYVKSAQHESLKRGFCLLVIDSEESNMVERRSVEFVQSHVDGIVLGSSRMSDTSIRKLGETVPIITINRPIRGVRSVIADARPGLEQAVEHLLELGHRRIAYLSGPEGAWQEGLRWQTLLSLSRTEGFALRRIGTEAPTYQAGCDAALSVIASACTAVLAYNDLMAIGLMTALSEHGVQVPEQVSVIGIDDIPMSSLVVPHLSTVRLPGEQVSAKAVVELVQGLHRVAGSGGLRPLLVDSEFVARDSVAPARGGGR